MKMPEIIDVPMRALIFVVVLFFFTKILGKKQLSELSFFEYISGITIGSIAGEVIMGLENNIFYGILGIAVFSLITLLVDKLTLKSKRFGDLVEGTSTVLIQDGKIMEKNLKKENYTLKELSSLLRQKNVFNISDVEFALLEPRGDLSLLLKSDKQPLTASSIGLKTSPVHATHTIISDGKVLPGALSNAGKNEQWLEQNLKNFNLNIEDIFYLQINASGDIEYDLFDDSLRTQQQGKKDRLLQSLNKCKSDLTKNMEQIKGKTKIEHVEECISSIDKIISSLTYGKKN
jgi:uncharacterized membrane protein YcaP (DUF421 family)